MNEYKQLCADVLNLVETTVTMAAREGKQDEQWFLDFLDRLNKISVLY